MENTSLWYGDLHLHTNLSYCAPGDTVPDTYLPYFEKGETCILGFANHLYPPYRIAPQDQCGLAFPGVERVLQIRPQLDALQKKTTCRILLGCEVENVFGKEPSLPRRFADCFDYILIGASHILNLPEDYSGYNLSTPEKLRSRMVERFLSACQLDYPVWTGICHPLYPNCCPWEQEVVDGISDSTLSDCFSLAAKKNISIEIHACLYRPGTVLDKDGLSPSYLRVLSAAKYCGCHFHFSTDAHRADAFAGKHHLLRLAAEKVGITKDDMSIL